jgi:hypothetical protein
MIRSTPGVSDPRYPPAPSAIRDVIEASKSLFPNGIALSNGIGAADYRCSTPSVKKPVKRGFHSRRF